MRQLRVLTFSKRAKIAAFGTASLLAATTAVQFSSAAYADTTSHTTSSDIEIVRTLRPAPNCVKELLSLPTVKAKLIVAAFLGDGQKNAFLSAIDTTCQALSSSSNAYPVDNFGNTAAFTSFESSKDYRGIAAIPSYDLTCTNGKVGGIAQFGSFYASSGYTKITIPTQSPIFNAGDGPANSANVSGNFASSSPVLVKTADNKSVDIALRVAGRISNNERRAQYLLLGYDAPYIWTVLHEKLNCDGTKQATVTYSDFPGISVYVSGQLISRDNQSTELARFSKDGGLILTAPGRGKYDPICRAYAVNAPGYASANVPARPLRADCQEGQQTGFLLPRKDYTASLQAFLGLASTSNIQATPGQASPPPTSSTPTTPTSTPPSIITASLSAGQVGTPYSATLKASGGTLPLRWSADSNSIPQGLSLSADGTLSGTPEVDGAFNFTVQVTDSSNRAATAAITLTITTATSLKVLAPTGYITLATTYCGTVHSYAFQAVGGIKPYTWSRTGGALPAGAVLSSDGILSLDESSPVNGGGSTFTVQVKDASGATATAAVQVSIITCT